MTGREDDEDIRHDPAFISYAKHALKTLVPMLNDSAVVMSLVPGGEPDIKYALELGLSIMMDKPIIAIASPDTVVPKKLAQVADVVIVMELGDPDFEAKVLDAMRQILAEDENTTAEEDFNAMWNSE